MRLLFDNNLSPALVKKLRRQFPGSAHVFDLKIHTLPDGDIWRYARERGYCVVTKDADFNLRSTTQGFPPKVIWLKIGNTATARIEAALRTRLKDIRIFEKDTKSGCLIIRR